VYWKSKRFSLFSFLTIFKMRKLLLLIFLTFFITSLPAAYCLLLTAGCLLPTPNSELRTQNLELRNQNLELRTQNSEFRTQSSKLPAPSSQLLIKTWVDTVSNCIDSILIVRIHVKNFIHVGSISLTLLYDDNVLAYDGFQNVNTNLANYDLYNFPSSPGYPAQVLLINYASGDITIPDGQDLLELRFIYLGDSTILHWDTTTPGSCEYTDPNFLAIPSTFKDGKALKSVPHILTQPQNTTVLSNTNTKLFVGVSTQHYHSSLWQLSTDAGLNWNNLSNSSTYSGVNTDTLHFSLVPLAYNTNRYRCLVTVCDETATSTVAILTVSESASIQGFLTYHNTQQSPISNTTMILKKNGSVIAQTLSASNGNYSFIGLGPGQYSIIVQCTKPWGGVNAIDAQMTIKHFTGLITLTGIYFTAGDVDGTHNINSIDGLQIARRYVGLINTFSVGNWTFDPASVTITTGGINTLNITGLCTGDINASNVPN
jgi:hypothetical protein